MHWKGWCWSWKSNTLATWCKELTHWKRPWVWERLKAEGEGDDRGWDGWMAPPTQRTWVWVDSGCWWWTGRPGVLWFMGSQRVRDNWATELNWTELCSILLLVVVSFFISVQFSCSVVSDSLRPHEPQHIRPPCPSATPGVHPNPCPLSHWCHPTISSSVVPFSSCPQSFPASGSFHVDLG